MNLKLVKRVKKGQRLTPKQALLMRKMLQEEVFVNSSTREELTAVLRREQIDTELSGEESVDPGGNTTGG